MFSWYKYLIVSLVFSHLGFWSGSLFLIAPFPDLCLFVLFIKITSFVFNAIFVLTDEKYHCLLHEQVFVMTTIEVKTFNYSC